MTAKEQPVCETCRFWADAGETDHEGESIGGCRKNPPIVNLNELDAESSLMDVVDATFWPVTNGYAWCGKHRPRTEPNTDGAVSGDPSIQSAPEAKHGAPPAPPAPSHFPQP